MFTKLALLGSLLLVVFLSMASTHSNLEEEKKNTSWFAQPLPEISPKHTESPYISPTEGRSFTNSFGICMHWIPPAEFVMGNKQYENSSPEHIVRLKNGYWISKEIVTRTEWINVVGYTPRSSYPYHDLAVDWSDAVRFCRKLSSIEGLNYRLPTEAEWEYSCLGPVQPSPQKALRNAYIKSRVFTQPNAFGLRYHRNNGFEWCYDIYHPNYLNAPTDGGPRLSGSKFHRVVRGFRHFELKKDFTYRSHPVTLTAGFRIALQKKHLPLPPMIKSITIGSS